MTDTRHTTDRLIDSTANETTDNGVHVTNDETSLNDTNIVECEQQLSPNLVDINIDFDWRVEPKQVSVTSFDGQSANATNNFGKGCKWSPDGSCLATNSDDHVLRLFDLPKQFCCAPIRLDDTPQQMKSVLNMRESEIIYDYCWFPKMNSTEPSTCLIATTSRDNPIHLWDAYNGQIVCTYRAYNYADEVISANCIAFNTDGTKIYSGFEKAIRVFDASIPGRQCVLRPTSELKQGQYGIISCVCVNPTNPNVYAVGSYDKSIGLYEEPSGDNVCVLVGQKGGVTHLVFSSDGNRLYSGGRKDSEILCWDIRNLGEILQIINRNVTTNQRIYFDITPDGRHLSTGNNDGMLSIYDISSEVVLDHPLASINSFKAHEDCVNGVSFHPTLPLLATTSGQRKFVDLCDDENEDLFCYKNIYGENSLKLWWFCKDS